MTPPLQSDWSGFAVFLLVLIALIALLTLQERRGSTHGSIGSPVSAQRVLDHVPEGDGQGSMMSCVRGGWPVVHADFTVAQALNLLRHSRLPARILDLFVVDSSGRLAGGVSLGRLLTANLGASVAGVMQPDVPSLPQTASIEEAADTILARRLLAMPIVDKIGIFVGAVDLVDLIQGASGQARSADPGRT